MVLTFQDSMDLGKTAHGPITLKPLLSINPEGLYLSICRYSSSWLFTNMVVRYGTPSVSAVNCELGGLFLSLCL